MSRLFALALLTVACNPMEPARRVIETRNDDPRPPAIDTHLSATTPQCGLPPAGPGQPVIVATNLLLLQHHMPLRWATAGRVYELGADPLRPIDLGDERTFLGRVWDDRYWYRLRCCCAECYDGMIDSFGDPETIEQIDRVTGKVRWLTRGHYGIEAMLPYGAYLYWGIFGHAIQGGVTRVLREGGPEEEVVFPTDDVHRHQDLVSRLVPYPDGILVDAAESIGWIPADGQPPRMVLRVADGGGAAVRDGDDFYVVEYGDGYGGTPASGYIHRVTADGTDYRLAGPILHPSAIAAHGDHVYFMRREIGDIERVPKAGGAVQLVFEPTDDALNCGNTIGMWADDRGLFWARGARSDASYLYFWPWPNARVVTPS